MKASIAVVLGLGIAAAVVGVAQKRRSPDPVEWTGPAGSGKPHLTRTTKGELLLTWLEARPNKRFALRVASTAGGRWSEPLTVFESDRFFVNWADFPSVTETSAGAWAVHWLEKTEAKPYAYHVRLSVSKDLGRTWSMPVTGHQDRSPTEHGFVAMTPNGDGSVAVAWLDGGRMIDSAGTMEARIATLGPDGSISGERVLDGRTCECCQVAMARAKDGLVVVYRDRSPDEVRDIAIVRERSGVWSAPALVARDNWVWKACPVNGPSVAAAGNEVGVAWFTAPGGKAKVQAAFSTNGGAGFGPPIQIDEGNPLGRAQFQFIGPGRGVVTWLESAGGDAVWRLREVSSTGPVSRAMTVGTTSRARDAGFPRTAVIGGNIYVAWSEPGATAEQGRVRISKVAVGR